MWLIVALASVTSECARCGVIHRSAGPKKGTRDRNCCHAGGSWADACGPGRTHTYREGFRACNDLAANRTRTSTRVRAAELQLAFRERGRARSQHAAKATAVAPASAAAVPTGARPTRRTRRGDEMPARAYQCLHASCRTGRRSHAASAGTGGSSAWDLLATQQPWLGHTNSSEEDVEAVAADAPPSATAADPAQEPAAAPRRGKKPRKKKARGARSAPAG